MAQNSGCLPLDDKLDACQGSRAPSLWRLKKIWYKPRTVWILSAKSATASHEPSNQAFAKCCRDALVTSRLGLCRMKGQCNISCRVPRAGSKELNSKDVSTAAAGRRTAGKFPKGLLYVGVEGQPGGTLSDWARCRKSRSCRWRLE